MSHNSRAVLQSRKPSRIENHDVVRDRLLVEVVARAAVSLEKDTQDEATHCNSPDRQCGVDRSGRVYRDQQVFGQTGNEIRHTGWNDDDYHRKGSQENRRQSASRESLNWELSDGRMLRALDGLNISSPKRNLAMSNTTMMPSANKQEWAPTYDKAKEAADKTKEAAASVGELASDAACAVGAMASQAACDAGAMASQAACDVGKKADNLTASAGVGIQQWGDRLSKNAPHDGVVGSASQAFAKTIREGGE